MEDNSSISVNDRCRFCHQCLKLKGVISHSTKIFEKTGQGKTVFHRLADLGLILRTTPDKSIRACVKCVNLLTRIERDLPVFRRWEEEENRTGAREEEAEEEAPVPTPLEDATPPETSRVLNRFCPYPLLPSRAKMISLSARKSVTEVITHYASNKVVGKACHPDSAGIVVNISKRNWKTAASLIMRHKELVEEVKAKVLELIQQESRTLCNPNQGFVLWKSSAEDMSTFSFSSLESDLKRLSPFLLSIFSTITNHSRLCTCAAAAIAVRGREPRVSAFAYYLNSILLHCGARKAAFKRLSKMAITTTHSHAVGKHKELESCGVVLQLLKVLNEVDLDSEADGNIDTGGEKEEDGGQDIGKATGANIPGDSKWDPDSNVWRSLEEHCLTGTNATLEGTQTEQPPVKKKKKRKSSEAEGSPAEKKTKTVKEEDEETEIGLASEDGEQAMDTSEEEQEEKKTGGGDQPKLPSDLTGIAEIVVCL